MVALISVFLVTVAMSMAALTLANAQRVLHGDGGQESAESHAESAEKEGVQAGICGCRRPWAHSARLRSCKKTTG